MIDAILAKARTLTGDQPFRYRFSSAGDPCLRALCYDARDLDDGVGPAASTKSLKVILHAECGKAVGAHLESAAKLLGYESQMPAVFDTGAVRVNGSSDITGSDIVLDVKLVSEKQWAKVQTSPRTKDRLQANGYAVAQDRPRWGVLYIRGVSLFLADTDEIEWRLHTGAADIALAQELCGIWEDVEQHRKLRTLPERVFLAKPGGWPCGWCRHLERCAPEAENA